MNEPAPIYAALKKYAEEENARLHMPGHIGGKGFRAEELRDVAAIDVTEIYGLDDLHLPVQAIKEACRLLADAYGAGESFLLVNGATSGIHALFMGVSQAGCSIMVPRNAHRSFFGGMVLAGAMPVYIPCRMEPELGVVLAINNADVAASLQKNPDVEAVFLASPSYYGTTSDIRSIAEVVKPASAKLLIDEAHGGHFPFHSSYPLPSLQGGADAVVNGLHKNLPVLNQGACLHLNSDFTARDKIFSACSLLTTTSPSYPIMASIDLARQLMVEEGEILLGKALQLSREFKARIAQIKGLHCYEEEELKKYSGVAGVDPLKVVISVKGLSIDGFQAADILRYKYKIQLELQEAQLILAMMSLFHEREDWQRLFEALLHMALSYPGIPKNDKINEYPPSAKVILSPREAFFAAKVRIALEESRNLISGEMISAYPPGIPCLLPGELITDEVMDYIQYLKETQARVQGPEDPDLNFISVIQP